MTRVRAAALALCTIFLAWIPFTIVADADVLPLRDPISIADVVLLLGVLLIGPMSLLILLVLTLRVMRASRLPHDEIADIRRTARLFGPFGAVWAIFKCTKGV